MKRDERYKMKEKDTVGKLREGKVNRKRNKIEETQILRRKKKKVQKADAFSIERSLSSQRFQLFR